MAIQPTPEDVIVPLGDYVNRGPDSPGAIDLLISLDEQCQVIPLMGNHEEMFLSGLKLSLKEGAIKDISEVTPITQLDFLNSCRDYYETSTHIFVHANYLPGVPLENQLKHYLRWEFLDKQNMQPHMSGKSVILGHTTQESGEILDLGFVKCIDTYCYGGGWLTALEVESGQVWQANLRGELRRE